MAKQRLSRREFLKRFSGALAAGPFLGSSALGEALGLEDRLRGERFKTPEELKVESIVERAYQLYFRETAAGGKRFLLRIPFGQRNERFSGQKIFMSGKGDPKSLWQKIRELLKEPGFAEYQEALLQPGRKLVLFNLPRKSYQTFSNEQEMEKTKARFKGNDLYPYEIKEDSSLSLIDIYNYLYCLGRVGVDCSGFSFYLQRFIALQYGIDLCEEIAKEWRVKSKDVPSWIGTWYYNRWNTERVDDKIINLRPGDLILFPDRRRPVVHSAVIRSIDLPRGSVRYVQCTDWVFNREERGPHASAVFFDRLFPEKSLSDPSLIWVQKLGPVFEGETCPYGNADDGFRYRLSSHRGKVVRLKRVAELLREKDPFYYKNVLGADPLLAEAARP